MVIGFDLTRPGFEPMIFKTRGEHVNHYTTDEPMIYNTRGEHANHYTTYVKIEVMYWYLNIMYIK